MSEINFIEMIRVAREDKEHLSFIDLPENTPVTVRIEKVVRKTNVKGSNGRNHKAVDFLKFKDKDKLLWLSLGKLKMLSSILGKNAADWIGKDVVLVADPTVKMAGVAVGGIVIKRSERSERSEDDTTGTGKQATA